MKNVIRLILSALFLAIWNVSFSSAFGQGALTPSGPPGPTMKSLDQIEARTPIMGSGAVTITNSGSYYLTQNITVAAGDAIDIAADKVSLDLNGFTITTTSSPPGGTAINLVGPRHSISIANGFIEGVNGFEGRTFAFNSGIDYSNTTAPEGVRVANVTVNFVLQEGIYLGENSSSIQSCSVDMAGDTGLYATLVSDSVAYNCGTGAGISGRTVNNCNASSYIGGYGIYAVNANNSVGTSQSGTGIDATYVNYCVGSSGGGDGLDTATAYNSTGASTSSTGNGLYASVLACNCTGNCSGSGIGLYAASAQSCVGYSPVGNAIEANTAQNCYGNSYSADGIRATTAENCYAFTTGSGSAIVVDASALNCYGNAVANGTGISVGVVGPNDGIFGVAQNCVGISQGAGIGISAINVNNCNGSSLTGTGISCSGATGSIGQASGVSSFGINASGIVIGCSGSALNGGLGLNASIANSCFGSSYNFGINKYNMP